MKNLNFQLSPQPFYYLLFFVLILFFSCEPDQGFSTEGEILQSDLKISQQAQHSKLNDFYGRAQPIGKGYVKSVVSLDASGTPVAMGVVFSEKALDALPSEPEEITLFFHEKAKGLVVDHIDFGWNPNGHPDAKFEVPHFDIHFYWITPEEKMVIPFTPPDPTPSDLPDIGSWPAGYDYDFVTIQAMGRHWIEQGLVEFDETFIYGSWNSSFIFYEPMITMQYLRDKNFDNSYPISSLGAYEKSGYYADTYELSFDPVKKQYRVMLTNLHWQDGD
ncbi:DUF5602 domain-containing protein [Christiangramia salexigens]|uniref:TTHB210-like domain-containing protein n=1 Tax=Christiangramia salexigens TaxID=1913577 RepID=A0A1L3J6F2_9FLAO|nr:DUF5602 domain-containing protein [Christiangramia salexigens]APG60683.1 hypothetical protein LPB144_09835 [Christiangramia salexigens]